MRGLLLALLLLVSLPACAKKEPKYSTWLYNETTEQSIVVTNDKQRPIASLTKLMTAMVAIDLPMNLNTQYRLSNKAGSRLPSKTYTKRELLTALLVRSDNAAAETLAENYPGGRKEFIKMMNSKAKRLGMNNTWFVDPTGLDSGNVSTVEDVSLMISKASKYEFITENSVKKEASFDIPKKNKTKTVTLTNTNRSLLYEFDNITTSKTGFTNAAGFCLALTVQKNDQKYIVVILGAKNPSQRADIAKELMVKI